MDTNNDELWSFPKNTATFVRVESFELFGNEVSVPKREGAIVGNASPTSNGRDDGIPRDTYKIK